jgi:hypothetical protein
MASRLCPRQKITGSPFVAVASPESSFHLQRNDALTNLSIRNNIHAMQCWDRFGLWGITKPLAADTRMFSGADVMKFYNNSVDQPFPHAAILIGKIWKLSVQYFLF